MSTDMDMARMRTSSSARRWLPRRLIARVVGAVLVAGVGYFATCFSLAQALAASNPSVAYWLARYNGNVESRFAASLSTIEATPASRRRADAMARHALIREPLAAVAASTLGLNADARGDVDAAQRAFVFSERLTRRNLSAQLWHIEAAVGRGNINAALYHYDVTLRTNPGSAGVLFPVLATANADPRIREALVRTLLARPGWGNEFASFLAVRGGDPGDTAALFKALAERGLVVPADARTRVIDALIMVKRVSDAWAFYATAYPSADPRRSRDPDFMQSDETPSRFDWVPINDKTASATIGRGGFDFSVPATTAGPLLEQLQVLPPGNYKLTGQGESLDAAPGATIYWSIICESGAELGRVEIKRDGRFSGVLNVPVGCPLQKLVLVTRSSDSIGELKGRIIRAALIPVHR